MSLLRWFVLRTPEVPTETTLQDRMQGLAELVDGAHCTQLVQLATALLTQARAERTPWRPRSMHEWLT